MPTGPRAFSNPRHRSRGPATGGAFPPRRPPIAGEGDSGAADPHPTARGAGGPGRGLAPGATRGPPFLSPEVPPPGEGALPIGAERTERGGGGVVWNSGKEAFDTTIRACGGVWVPLVSTGFDWLVSFFPPSFPLLQNAGFILGGPWRDLCPPHGGCRLPGHPSSPAQHIAWIRSAAFPSSPGIPPLYV